MVHSDGPRSTARETAVLETFDIHPSRIPPNNQGLRIVVTAASITADGVDVFGSTPRQDFAIAVENAHE